MQRFLSIGSALLLMGCGGADDAARDRQQSDAAAMEDATYPTLAPAFDWTGDWVATPEHCRDDGRWRLARDRIVAIDGTNCTVDGEKVEVDGVISLDLTCTADGASTPERWVLEPIGDRRITVTRVAGGNVIAKVALGRCG